MERIIEAVKAIPGFWSDWWEVTFKGELKELNIYLTMGIAAVGLIIVLIWYLKKKRR